MNSHEFRSLDYSVPSILRYAAAKNNSNVLAYLLRQPHDTGALLADPKFVSNLMSVGRTNKFKSVEEFVFVSPAPCETAANLSSLYR